MIAHSAPGVCYLPRALSCERTSRSRLAAALSLAVLAAPSFARADDAADGDPRIAPRAAESTTETQTELAARDDSFASGSLEAPGGLVSPGRDLGTLGIPPADSSSGELRWQAGWNRVSTGEYAFTGALAAGVVAGVLGFQAPRTGIPGGLLFDDGVRGALRLHSEEDRRSARSISDLTQSLLIAYPFVVDTAAVTWLINGNGDTAWQMFMINAQSFLLTTAANLITKNLVGRERPYVQDCAPGSSCGSDGRNKSFFSGHTAAAFTGAGLICAHHENLPLYGNSLADGSACAGALALAATTGALRIAGDEHYATDVLVGTAVGLLSGYVLPKLAYYSRSHSSDAA